MKNIKTTFLCVILFVSHSVIFAQHKYNLSFDELDSVKQEMPKGWFKWGNFKNISGEKLGEDNFVGKVVSDPEGKFGCITYSIPANYVGDTIQLTGRIKYENVKKYVGLLIRIDGFTLGERLGFDNMQRFKIKGTSDWKEYSIKIPFSNKARNINVGGLLSGEGTAWFDDFKVTIDGKDIQTLEETPKNTLANFNKSELQLAITKSAKPLNLSDEESLNASLDALISKLGNKKIVAIGESTHGTSEFYKLREAITKRLIQEKGFNMVVLESPYDDIELLNESLSNIPLNTLIQKHLLSIYQTKEMESFLEWYRDNRTKYNVKFKGCDDSYWGFYELLENNIGSISDKKLSKLLQNLKSNLAKSNSANSKKETKINISIYNDILAIENQLKSTNSLTSQVEEILFNGKNTYINYLNIKNGKPFQSRDEIMADRISYLAKDEDNKIVVWAHNAHISKEIITGNEIGIMGRDLKKEFGNEYYSVGLSTLQGSYSYIDEKFINGDHNFRDTLKTANLQATKYLFWEKALALNGNSFYLDMLEMKNELKNDEILGPTRLIGYRKETYKDNYFLPIFKNFDSFIFIETTKATTPVSN